MHPEVLSRALFALRDPVVDDVLARWPGAAAAGERGRRHCEQDTQYHLENLATAVALRTPTLFQAYATWAEDVLAARGIPSGCLPLALEVIRERLPQAGLPPDTGALAGQALTGALRAVGAARPRVAAPAPDGFSLSVEGDRRGLLELVSRWQEEGGVTFALRQIARLQHEVGEAWLRNEITVAQEHRATALAQLALSMLAPHTAGAPGPRSRGRAVVACAEGDWHVVGPRIASDLLELDGYEVEFLGANTPVPELVRSCREVKPTLVGIGCAPLAALPAARAAAEAIRKEFPGLRVLVGGRAARIAGPEPLGADVVAPADFDGKLAS